MKKAKFISLIMVVIMVSTFISAALVGCSKEKGHENKAALPEDAIVFATNVQFDQSGHYTTTVTCDKATLSALTSENVEVRYADPYANVYTYVSSEETQAASEKNLTLEEALPCKATISRVVANANGGYDVEFVDKDAKDYVTSRYYMVLKNYNVYSEVNVEFPSVTLTSDIESVYAGTEEFRVALTIHGGEFADDIDIDDLFNGNAFEDTDAEILSKSNNNLTLKIMGTPTKNVAGAYQWGVIGVKSSGIKNGYADIHVKIPVILDYAAFDASSLKFENGKINANVKVYGVADVDALTKDNVSVDGAIVEALSKADDHTIRLTLAVEDVESVNDFVDVIKGGKLTLAAYETDILLAQANFYPVFDYVEKVGNDLELTLKLYIYGGTIDNTFTAEKIELGDDFAGATVKSLTVEENNLATMIISVPNGGFGENDYNYDGDVTIKAGAVTNAWGEKTSIDFTYARNYSAENLGREVTLNADTLSAIQDYTRGLDTTFGKVCYYAGVAGQVFGIVKNVAEMAGIIKSEHQQVMDKLEEMDQKLTVVQADVAEIKQIVNTLAYETKYYARDELRRDLRTKVDGFQTTLLTMNNALDVVKSIYQKAALDMAIDDAIDAGKLTEKPSFIGLSAKEIAEKKAELRNLYLPNADEMTNEAVAQYNVRLIQYINEKAKDPNNTDYYGYSNYVMSLEDIFKTVCGLLEMPTGSNPIGFYDELVAQIYNFDSQTYNFRLANRVIMQYKLTNAIGVLAFHYQVAANPDSTRYQLIGDAFNKAVNSTIWEISGHPASEIKANPHYAQQSEVKTYISEVLLVGTMSHDDSRNYLRSNGYTIASCNLNDRAYIRKNTNRVIYLGYKTTTNPNEAITGFYLHNVYQSSLTVDGKTYYPVQTAGGEDFVASGGDCNHGCARTQGNAHIYLYYTKDNNNNKCVGSISFNDTPIDTIAHSEEMTGNFNQNSGGDNIFMHASLIQPGVSDAQVNTLVETDPEYYPYSYAFGKKVSFYVSAYLSVDYDAEIRSVGNVKVTWTENEIKEFLDRCHTSKLFNGELSSAGARLDQMYNGGSTNVLYLSGSYLRGYHRNPENLSQWRYYIDLGLLIMDENWYRRTYD
ncbi:MAG: hypothetical protein IJ735_06585 [Clostridia bacterium]|nr:hypothetical protein [Clostridia bacterium]